MSSHQESGDGNAEEEASYNYSYNYNDEGDPYYGADYDNGSGDSAYYYGESDYYGESGDDYGDSVGNGTFESKFDPLKRFALNVHTGKYDNEIGVELRTVDPRTRHHFDFVESMLGNRHEINHADLEERRAIAVEKLKSQLKGLTHQADAGILDRIYLSAYPTITEDPVLSHDPSTEMHWHELFTSMKNSDKTVKIFDISILKIEMKEEIVDQLMRSLPERVSNLCGISFNHTNLSGEGLLSLSKLVELCPVLHSLDLSYNMINDTNAAYCLSRALKSHPSIYHLTMTTCNLGTHPAILAAILQSEVISIDLSNNNIDSLGVVEIVECIEGNSPIHLLALGYNNLNDGDVLDISRALRKNTTLTGLNLLSNDFTSLGVKSLFSSVFDNSSLNAISKSNHTCKINVAGESITQTAFTSINKDLNRTDKVLLALLDKETLLEYLSDVPIEFMPAVLAFLQRNAIAIINPLQRSTLFCFEMTLSHILNMLYSSMRWWNMPTLYSYHGNVVSGIKRKR
jgi:hypothetical protein